jgi:hypothetical protein
MYFFDNREAVEHFLTALVQQSQANLNESYATTDSETNNGATDPTTTPAPSAIRPQHVQQMSDTIWSTLRLALSFLNRSDLYTACLSKDLDKLRADFKI